MSQTQEGEVEMNYWWYRLKCTIFGHTLSCCDNIKKRCKSCHAEGRIYPEACNSCNAKWECHNGLNRAIQNCDLRN